MAVTPNDLQNHLRQAGVLDRFNKMSPSHRREYIDYLEEAKKSATRSARLDKIAGMIAATG